MFDVKKYNETDSPYPIERLEILFDKMALTYPERIVLKKGKDSITYEYLYRESESIAARIIQEYGKGINVAIKAEKSWHTIACMLGVLKAGGCFIPVSPEIPEERIQYILQNSEAEVYIDDLAWRKCNDGFQKEKRRKQADINDPAYIIYTSGSSGNPKGVIVSHRAVVNTLMGVNQTFNIAEENVYLSISSFCFDLSIYDIFAPLILGGRLVLPEKGNDLSEYSRMLESEAVTIWNSVPIILENFLRFLPESYVNETISVIMLSGDWIPVYMVDQVKAHFPKAQIFSLGGATEGGIWSIYYPIKAVDKNWTSIPYGYPLPNQKIYLYNENQKIFEEDLEGEICIAGLSVANGYINNEKENCAFQYAKGEQVYRTGDYGIYKSDGYVEIKGRRDQQHKIKGNRIELAELDKVANEYSNVLKAIADVKTIHGEKCIVLYYQKRDGFELNQLKKTMMKSLPQYMCPLYYVEMDEIPVNINDKVDRNKLPVPQVESANVQPFTELELEMIKIWEEVLGVHQIDLDSDFFELGGDSLQAQILVSEVKEHFQVEIDLRYLLEETTVRRACLCVMNEKRNEECA